MPVNSTSLLTKDTLIASFPIFLIFSVDNNCLIFFDDIEQPHLIIKDLSYYSCITPE